MDIGGHRVGVAAAMRKVTAPKQNAALDTLVERGA
jgi:hypothetical protein